MYVCLFSSTKTMKHVQSCVIIPHIPRILWTLETYVWFHLHWYGFNSFNSLRSHPATALPSEASINGSWRMSGPGIYSRGPSLEIPGLDFGRKSVVTRRPSLEIPYDSWRNDGDNIKFRHSTREMKCTSGFMWKFIVSEIFRGSKSRLCTYIYIMCVCKCI